MLVSSRQTMCKEIVTKVDPIKNPTCEPIVQILPVRKGWTAHQNLFPSLIESEVREM